MNKCKRHKWADSGWRLLRLPITRGFQTANAESYKTCEACGKEQRVLLLNIAPQSIAKGQVKP